VAGLLEGEGCFTLIRQSNYASRSSYRRAAVFCNMTDEDVVRHLQQLVGIGRITFLRNKRKPNHKPTWRWRVEGPPAIKLMEELLPHMFSRRSNRIREVITVHAAERIRGKEAQRAWALTLNARRRGRRGR